MSGFSISATLGDSDELSGVARNTTSHSGNTCSATIGALEGSRLPLGSQHFKQTNENNAMQNTQTPAMGAPAHLAKGFNPTSTGTPCLIPFQTFLDALHQAHTDKANKGKGQAYAQLLNAFHQAILPLFFAEAKGNLSEVSRLMGIHRETITVWCKQLDLNSRGEVHV
jgi:DNA-binding protein Fis